MRRSNNITGSAFIEFNSNKTARYFINEYNNKKINGHLKKVLIHIIQIIIIISL